MFCSAKVTWFMQNASEAIECLRREHGETLYSLTRRFIEHGLHGLHGFVSGNVDFPLIPWRVEVLNTDCTDCTDKLLILGDSCYL